MHSFYNCWKDLKLINAKYFIVKDRDERNIKMGICLLKSSERKCQRVL